MSGGLSVAYLCLQAAREGQASYAHVHEIIGGLERRGHTVRLFDVAYGDGASRAPGPAGRVLEFRRTQRRLVRSAGDADVVYIRAHPAAGMTARWARGRGVPVVQEVNGPYEDLFTAWPKARLFERQLVATIREQYRAADALIAVTPRLAEWLHAETGRNDAVVIPNGANTVLFAPGGVRPAGLPERYALFFGAFAPWQGIDTLIEAVDDPAWPDGVSLVLAGNGMERQAVEAAAAARERVVYLGSVAYADMPGVISASVAGLIPKAGTRVRSETGLSPLKLYETLSCGVPAIVTDLPGLAELVRKHDAGLVVPPDDPAELARAVARLAEDPSGARAMGERGRAAVVAGHSWDARAAVTSALLESLAGERSR